MTALLPRQTNAFKPSSATIQTDGMIRREGGEVMDSQVDLVSSEAAFVKLFAETGDVRVRSGGASEEIVGDCRGFMFLTFYAIG